jgi:pyruvate dehydrogenase E1 component alpha subunit
VALGHAYAAWLEGSDAVAVGVTGEGGANAGAFHEVLNMAGAWRLPLIVLVENNRYAISVPLEDASATATIAERAPAYAAWGRRVDGTDVEVVAEAFAEAVEQARGGGGPALLEATCYRFQGHYEGDTDHYRNKREKQAALDELDPLAIARRRLLERGEATAVELDRVVEDADSELRALLAEVRSDPMPAADGALDLVFAGQRR